MSRSTILLALICASPLALAQGTPEPKPAESPSEKAPAEPGETDKPDDKPAKPAPKPGEKGWKGGRVKFKRTQGTAAELKAKFVAFQKELAARYPSLGKTPSKDKPKEGPGLEPPGPKTPKTPEKDEPKKDPVLETLRSFQPTKPALEDLLTRPGLEAMGRQIFKSGEKLFASDVPTICKRLKLRPELTEVEVFSATTEDLLTMDLESDAAREFASGLRRTARFLKPRYRWFVVVLNRPQAVKDKAPAPKTPSLDPADARLQLWGFSQGRYVLLGKIWRRDK